MHTVSRQSTTTSLSCVSSAKTPQYELKDDNRMYYQACVHGMSSSSKNTEKEKEKEKHNKKKNKQKTKNIFFFFFFFILFKKTDKRRVSRSTRALQCAHSTHAGFRTKGRRWKASGRGMQINEPTKLLITDKHSKRRGEICAALWFGCSCGSPSTYTQS